MQNRNYFCTQNHKNVGSYFQFKLGGLIRMLDLFDAAISFFLRYIYIHRLCFDIETHRKSCYLLLITSLYNFNLSQHLHFMQNEHCKLFFTTFQTLVKHFECCHFDLIINGVNFCLPKVLFCNYNGRLHAKTCFLYIVSQIICAFLLYQTLMLCIKAIKMQFLVFQVL